MDKESFSPFKKFRVIYTNSDMIRHTKHETRDRQMKNGK